MKINRQQLPIVLAFFAGIFPCAAQNSFWTNAAPLPQPTWELGTAAANGLVYAVGGGTGPCSRTSGVYAYNPTNNTWTAKASMPVGIGGFALGNLNGTFYAIGGESGCGAYGADTAVSAYNSINNTWTSKNPFPVGVIYSSAAVANGTLYGLGGFVPSLGVWTNAVFAYNPTNDSWSLVSAFPQTISYFGSAVANNIIYIIGGEFATSLQTNVWSFNPATGIWVTNAAAMPVFMGSTVPATINGIIYVAGGGTSGGASSVVEAYNPQVNTWTAWTNLPQATEGASCAALNGNLYVIAGETGEYSQLANVQVFAPPNGIGGLNLYAGLTVLGLVGEDVQINYKTNLASANWLSLTNFVLPSNPYLFIDTSAPATWQRFYQAVITP